MPSMLQLALDKHLVWQITNKGNTNGGTAFCCSLSTKTLYFFLQDGAKNVVNIKFRNY